MAAVQLPSGHWLADRLCDLMASPHISMPSGGGLYLGPGPVDLFSTRFNNYFASDCEGQIHGRPVDREGLKDALLKLQRHWDPENVRILKDPRLEQALGHTKMSAEFEWMPKNTDHKELVWADARVEAQGGRECIKYLALNGEEALFQV